MKKPARILTHVLVYALLIAFFATTVCAVVGYDGYELVVEETSNFFPSALTGYKDIASLYGDEEDRIIYAEYRICAPGYRIAELDFELTYDEESLEFVEGDFTITPTGTIGEQTNIIPEISDAGEYSFEPWAESETEGRGRMTLHYMGYANASGEMDEDIVLVRVPFQIYSSDLGMVNIDMKVTTLTLSIIPVPGSDFAENAPTYDTLFVVADGMVNKEYDDLYSLITVLSPTGDDLIEHEEKTLTITGTSDFCPDIPAQEYKVGEDHVILQFVAPDDLELTYLSLEAMFDSSKVQFKGASITHGELGKLIGWSYNSFAYVLDCPDSPVKVKKGEEIATFNFSIVGEGETAVVLYVNTQKGGHNVTIDMGGYMDNIVVEVEDGANLYETLKSLNLSAHAEGEYVLTCLHTKPLSEMKSKSEYQSVYFIDENLFNKPVKSDVTVYAIWLKKLKFEAPAIPMHVYGTDLKTGPEITVPANAHYTVSNTLWSYDYPLEGIEPRYQMSVSLVGGLIFGHFTAEPDFGYVFDFDMSGCQVPSFPPDRVNKLWSSKSDYGFIDVIDKNHNGLTGYGFDLSFVFVCKECSGDKAADKTAEEINLLPQIDELTPEDAEAVKAAKEAYEALTDEQKKLIPKETVDKLMAEDVAVDISSLPLIDKITLDDKEAIEAVKKAYDKLTDEQKKLVPQELVDQLLVSELTLDVITLPDTDKLTLGDKEAVKAAKEAFDKLTDEQKVLVPQETVDKLKAADAITDILSLPDADKITANDKAAIEAARKAYEELTEEQKKLVSQEVLDKLLSAEEAIKKSSIEMPSVFVIIIIVVAVAAVLFLIVFLVSKKKKKQ